MALAIDLIGLGIAPEVANRLGYAQVAVNAAGTTQGTATPLKAPSNIIATVTPAASQQGVRLDENAEIGSVVAIVPAADTPLITVYPPTGGTIDALAANAGLAFATANKNALFMKVTATNWRSFISGEA